MSLVWDRRWTRALEIPPANHRKMLSETAVAGVCSACKEPATSRSKSHRTQRFTKPSSSFGGFVARESPCGQNSPAAVWPIGHRSNFEGHGPRRQGRQVGGRDSVRLSGTNWVTLFVVLLAECF